MKRFRILILLISCVILINGIHAQDLTGKIDEAVNAFVELQQFSGTVLVAKDGKPFYAKAFGEADKDHHVKNTLKTKFNIGSIGKTITGTAIMQLAEKGKLKVTDLASKYLTNFPFGDEITIHHLLSHTAGTFNYMAHPDYRSKMATIRNVNDILPLIYDQDLLFKNPGERFSYSNSGIVLLGAIIEQVTGQTYSDYIRKNILDPIGMNDTGINFLDQPIENRAAGYVKTPSGRFIRNIYMVPPASADGGIETTVLDLLKFDQALYGDKLLGESYKQKMFTPNLNNYGYCWRISKQYGNTVIAHSGGAPGVNAAFQRYINDKYTIIVLSNYDVDRGRVAGTIEAILFGADYELPRPTREEFLYGIMDKKGTESLLKNYNTLLKENEYRIPNSTPLNIFGYGLLQEHKVDYAIAIFKLNVELFPDEANPYDSLGDGYLQIGDKQSAIKAFKKALEIDSSFSSSKEKLDELLKNN
ncbi:serine hydrolase [bacterium]